MKYIQFVWLYTQINKKWNNRMTSGSSSHVSDNTITIRPHRPQSVRNVSSPRIVEFENASVIHDNLTWCFVARKKTVLSLLIYNFSYK